MKRKRLLVLIASVLFVLAGCSTLPRSGGVHAVEPSATRPGEIGLVAQPPAQDSSPAQIVAGFMVASAAGIDDDFAVARQYLSGTAASEWNPLAEVRVYPDAQNPQTDVSDNGGIKVTLGSLGTLSDKGVYSESANDATITKDFSLAKNADGQWRIVNLDDGFSLSKHLFDQLFVEAPLYFLSASQSALVAELHWYPRRSFPTQSVRALLSGPAPWLAGGVGTAFPDGTTLASSVVVTDGVATVDLSSEVLSASEDQRGKMLAQLRKTLGSISSIQQVKVAVEGTAMTAALIPDLSVYPLGSYSLSVLSNGIPATVSDNLANPVVSPETVAGLGLESLAVGYQASDATYAALGSEGAALYAIDSAHNTSTLLATGTDLIGPSIDVNNWVWSGEINNPGALQAYQPATGVQVSVGASWLQGVSIVSMAVSREGSRIVFACDVGGEIQVQVASISRDSFGTPTHLNEPIQVGQRLASVTDLSWIGPTDLVVLGVTAAGSDAGLYKVPLGGPTERLASPSSPVTAITSGRDEQSIAGLTETGFAIGRSGGAWRSLASDITAVAYPG